jgi:hypothetical protein
MSNAPEGDYNNTQAPGTNVPSGKPHAKIDV